MTSWIDYQRGGKTTFERYGARHFRAIQKKRPRRSQYRKERAGRPAAPEPITTSGDAME